MKRFLIGTFVLLLVLAICAGLIWFNFFRDQMIAQYFAGMRPQPVTVAAAEVRSSTWRPGIDAVGTVTAIHGVDVAVEAAGVIREIGFKANDEVAEGQLLVQIDDSVDRAGLASAHSSVAVAQEAVDRIQALLQSNVSTIASLQTAQNQLDQATGVLAQLEAQIGLKSVEAPFAGTIGIPKVDLGQYVQPGTPVATLQDLRTMKVDFTVPEQVLPQLAIGQEAAFGLAEGDMRFSGKVTGIEPKVDPSSRLVSVQAELANPDGLLRPGQFIRVRVLLPAEDGVVAVPQTAVILSLYGSYVYRIEPAEDAPETLVARQVFVETGRRSGTEIEIRSGLEAGAQIAIAGQNKLSNGSPVAIDNSVVPGDATAAAGGQP